MITDEMDEHVATRGAYVKCIKDFTEVRNETQ